MDENCIASQALGQLLERKGYAHVLHFAGGLAEWEQAGYPLEGEWISGREIEGQTRRQDGDERQPPEERKL